MNLHIEIFCVYMLHMLYINDIIFSTLFRDFLLLFTEIYPSALSKSVSRESTHFYNYSIILYDMEMLSLESLFFLDPLKLM